MLDRIRQDQVKTKWPQFSISPLWSPEVSKVTPQSPGTTPGRSCLPKGHWWGDRSSLPHGTAKLQKGHDTQHCVCPANGAFPNQSQLFALAALASQGIALHGSIRTAVIYLTKTAGAKLCLQLSGAIKTRHPPKAGCNRSCHAVAVRVLPLPAQPCGAFLRHVVCSSGRRRNAISPILSWQQWLGGMVILVDHNIIVIIAASADRIISLSVMR